MTTLGRSRSLWPHSTWGGRGTHTASVIEEQTGMNHVKSKRFVMSPVTAAEAAMEMGLFRHDFFFFANVEPTLPGVVYRRSDGTVGLIDEEPRV